MKHKYVTKEILTAYVLKQAHWHLGMSEDAIPQVGQTIEELGGDSLDAIEMVFYVEDEFGIEVSEKAAAGIVTIHDLIEVTWTEIQNG